MAPPGGGMCVQGGTVVGDSELREKDDPALERGKDSHEIKELLETAFKVERDVFIVEQTLGDPLSNFRLTL